jgi:DNA-binding Lrp family transcriptional regulator
MASLVGVSVHEKNFLIDEITTLTTFTEKVEEIEIDAIGKKVLNEIYWDAKKNIAEIAFNLKTTVDIVRTRLQNFKKNKIIIRYSAIIDYQKIGYEYYKAFVYLKDVDDNLLKKINEYIKNNKVIINMVKQIASWDLELVLFAQNFAEYDSTMGQFTKEFSKNVIKIETATMREDIIFPCNKLVFE